ncbi:GNAT family N-acetyltransferase [Jannaschia pohangensis]|uniref:Protein N-acetyltransferase, RimJ/RimL family n=1 Tax=Jannaschia pohangensis TaxID=390807 RepID=A0A1I3MHE9_9RHOB|nr:GNAT family N-acetyltransferase [Jannaschia pohangensis]SFI96190.1 Protein N-acetyltransferase, RimJ/RimL family [Jannaschia pohangensis]
MPDPLASTADVVLRRLRPDDLPEFQAYRRDPEVARYQSWTPMDDGTARAFLAHAATAPLFEDGQWSQIGIASQGRLVGDMGLCRSGEAVEVGITLARPAQGHGTGRIAMELAFGLIWARTGANRIIGITDARNAPSIRLMEACGMVFVSRDDAVFNGEDCVELTYALPRPQPAP